MKRQTDGWRTSRKSPTSVSRDSKSTVGRHSRSVKKKTYWKERLISAFMGRRKTRYFIPYPQKSSILITQILSKRIYKITRRQQMTHQALSCARPGPRAAWRPVCAGSLADPPDVAAGARGQRPPPCRAAQQKSTDTLMANGVKWSSLPEF